ncbi:MAG: trigger factor [Coriobacteriales bacterium]
MKIKEKKHPAGRVTIEAKASAKEVESAFETAYFIFAQTAGLQPQAGKTVPQVAREKLGIKDLDSLLQDKVMEALVPFAIDKSGLQPAYPPQVIKASVPQHGRELSFALDLQVKPHYELSSYDPVSITVPPFSVDESLVDKQLEELAKRSTEYGRAAEQRAVRKGDSVLLEMRCVDKASGEEIKALCSKARTFCTGKGNMPQGFEDAVIGMEPGQEKSFEFEGPDIDERGRETVQIVEATVRVIELQEERTPAITDEWVASHIPTFKTVDELRGNIRRSLESYTREQYDGQCRQMCTAQLAQRFEGRIPDEAYEAMRADLLANLDRELSAQGLSRDEFIEQQGGEQQFSMMLIVQSREMLAQGYALDALFEHEGLVLEDADYTLGAKELEPRRDPLQTRQQLERTGRKFILREAAQRRKAAQWALDHASITVQE